MYQLTERLTNIPEAKCKCYVPPFSYKDYEITPLGIDETKGRFAEVSIQTCISCGTKWIKYLVEFEGYSESARWYRGIINESDLPGITPKTTIRHLENLEWYVFGGSYFSSTGMYGKGRVQADFFPEIAPNQPPYENKEPHL